MDLIRSQSQLAKDEYRYSVAFVEWLDCKSKHENVLNKVVKKCVVIKYSIHAKVSEIFGLTNDDSLLKGLFTSNKY